MADTEQLRTLLLQTAGGALMVPDTAMAEVVAHPEWMPLPSGDWVLGQMEWRGYRLPLVSLDTLFGQTPALEGEHVAVMNTSQNDNGTARFYGILLTALPKLVRLKRSDLDSRANQVIEASRLRGIRSRYAEQTVMVPDLALLENRLPPAA